MTHAIISNVEVMTKFVTTTVVLALPDDTQQVCNYVKRAVIKAIWKNKCFIYYGNLLIFSDNINYISKGMCIYIYIYCWTPFYPYQGSHFEFQWRHLKS